MRTTTHWSPEDIENQCPHLTEHLTPGNTNTLEDISNAYAIPKHNRIITLPKNNGYYKIEPRTQPSEHPKHTLHAQPEPKLAGYITQSNASKDHAERTGNPDQAVAVQDIYWYEREVEAAIKKAQKLNEKIKRKAAKRKDFPPLNPNMDAQTREGAYESYRTYRATMKSLQTLAARVTFDLCKLRGITAEGVVTRAKLDKNLEAVKEAREKVDALAKLYKLL